ncbi:MAG: hypothetical protein ACOYY2_12975 [Actinomycetota bacterium]
MEALSASKSTAARPWRRPAAPAVTRLWSDGLVTRFDGEDVFAEIGLLRWGDVHGVDVRATLAVQCRAAGVACDPLAASAEVLACCYLAGLWRPVASPRWHEVLAEPATALCGAIAALLAGLF